MFKGGCEPFGTCGDLADVCVRVTHCFLERFEDATCGLKLQSLIATLSWNVTQERSRVLFVFNAKGKVSTYGPYLGKGQTVLGLL